MNKRLKIFWCFSIIINIVSCTSLPGTPPPTNEGAAAGNYENNNDLEPLSINTVPPEDILREVSWFPGGGPGGGSSICTDADKSPFIRYDPYDTELMNSSGMTTCGWQSQQKLQTSITFPNGEARQEVTYADEDGMANASITPDISDPEGVYEFTISDDVTVLKSNAYFRKPIVPRIHLWPDNRLRFYNFPASEPLRLFMYKCTNRADNSECRVWEFIGWQEYQVSVQGDLEVQVTDIKDIYYVAVTASGMEIGPSESSLPTTIVSENSHFFEGWQSYWEKSQEYLLCTESAPFLDSHWGQIVDTSGEGIDLYSQPRASARSMDKLQNGTVFYILINDPECAEGDPFWEVNVLDGQFKFSKSGYVRLADFDGTYYFKSIMLSKGNKTECGAMTSYLSVGDRGKVVSSDGSNLRLRDKPGVDQKIIGLLPEGTPFLVLDGLECIDNTAWWKVHTNAGAEGWAAEYRDNEYLLTLVDSSSCFGMQGFSRLSIGDMAKIATDDGTALRVRSRAGLVEGDILFSIPSGRQVSIVEGPVCSWEGNIWWRVVTEAGNTGWMAEYQNGIYYLQKVP